MPERVIRFIVQWRARNGVQALIDFEDEAAALAKKAQAEKVYQFALAEFQKPLPWCMDLPLNAEGGHAHNYSK